MPKHFLHLTDYTSEHIWDLLHLAKELKVKFQKKENYIKEGSEREKKTLGDLIDDIYNKINFLRDEISDIKDHAIKLTLQGNKIFQMLNDDKGEITISKIKKLEDFDKDFYLIH